MAGDSRVFPASRMCARQFFREYPFLGAGDPPPLQVLFAHLSGNSGCYSRDKTERQPYPSPAITGLPTTDEIYNLRDDRKNDTRYEQVKDNFGA
jgi:hypothetical protein